MSEVMFTEAQWLELAQKRMAEVALGAIDPVSAAVLALMPRCTARIAEVLGVSPTRLRELADANYLLEFMLGDERHYEPSATWRSLALAALIDPAHRSAVVARLPALDEAGMPEDLASWRALAGDGTAHQARDRLAAETERLARRVTPDDTSAVLDARANELLAWIDAAHSLKPMFDLASDDRLYVAIDRAERRAGYLRRTARDRVYLTHYVDRAELDTPFERLLDDPAAWCLHYVGAGGTGKTMLIRHLVDKIARGRDTPIARIDFDRLNPDFPFKNPKVFFDAITAELAPWSSETRERELVNARATLDKLQIDLLVNSQLDPVDNDHFRRAAAQFRDYFRAIAGDGPVVVILDTCEELAKYRVDDRPSPALAKTIEIIETLRYGRGLSPSERSNPSAPELAQLRVVFAGRRLLSPVGVDYTAKSPQVPRPYLELCVIRGFTDLEAREYLLEKRKVSANYVTAILAASPEVSKGPDVTWIGGRAPADGPRFHPYELDAFATLTLAPAPPPPEDIRDAIDDAHIEVRIVRRLDDSPLLLRLLPTITALGHIDVSLLHVLVGPDQLVEARVLVAEQDWMIEEQGWGEECGWSVDDRLLPRLECYYAQRPVSETDLAAVRGRLDTWLKDGDLARFDWQLIDAALRVKPCDVDFASVWTWWLGFERRMFAERGSTWTADVLDRLVSRGLPAAEATKRPDAPYARALVIATLVCAMPRNEAHTIAALVGSISSLQHGALGLRILATMSETAGGMEGSPVVAGPIDLVTQYAIAAAAQRRVRDEVATLDWSRILSRLDGDADLVRLRDYIGARHDAVNGDAAGCERRLQTIRLTASRERIAHPHAAYEGVDLDEMLALETVAWFAAWGGDITTLHISLNTESLDALALETDLDCLPVPQRGFPSRLSRTEEYRTGRPQLAIGRMLAIIGRPSEARLILEEVQKRGDAVGFEAARLMAWMIRAYQLWELGIRPNRLSEAAIPGGKTEELQQQLDALAGYGEPAPLPKATPALPALPCRDAARWVGSAARGIILETVAPAVGRTWLDEAARRIGRRRVAELVLAESERLAIHLGDTSAPGFKIAAHYFRELDDAVGELRVLVSRVLIGKDRSAAAPTRALIDRAFQGEGVDDLRLPLVRRANVVDALARGDLGFVRSQLDVMRKAAPKAIEVRTLEGWLPAASGIESYTAPARLQLHVESPATVGPESLRRDAVARWRYGESITYTADLAIDVLAPYVELTGKVPSNRLAVDTGVVETVVSETLHAVCWEACFPDAMVCRISERQVPSRGGAVYVHQTIIAHDTVLRWLGHAVPGTVVKNVAPDDGTVVELARTPAQAPNARLCHLIGYAIDDGLTHGPATYRFDNLAVDDHGATVGVTTLRQTLAATPLFLLQGLPYREGAPARNSTTRLKAGTQRRFAGELAESGSAVLIVPPLGRADSLALARREITRILLDAKNTDDLVAIARKLRTEVLARSDDETSLDVCLYAPHDWKPAPRPGS